LDRHVSQLDLHRMDPEGLYDYICHLLSDDTLEKLNAFNELDINKSIADSALKSSRSLPWMYTQPLSVRLMKLKTDPITLEKIRRFVLQSKKTENWNKYKLWLVLLIALAICYLIYATGS
ncbi:MAG: hypothetical protein ACHQFX_11965, partial [Chitinophagales bacterium]